MMFKTKKGGLNFQLVLVIIAVIFLLWAILGPGRAFATQQSAINTLSKNEDCDGDGLRGVVADKCPCAKGEKGSELPGCPKGITTSVPCKKDQCKKLIDERIKKGAPSSKSQDTSNSGLKGNYDLTFDNIKIKEGSKTLSGITLAGGTHVITKKQNSVALDIEYSIKNNGPSNVDIPFKATVFVCDHKDRVGNCKTKTEQSYTLLKADGKSVTTKKKLTVGVNGDACDGSGEKSCYVKVKVDSGGALKETSETNNEVGFVVTFKTKEFKQFKFNSYQIELVENNGGDAILVDNYCLHQPISKDLIAQFNVNPNTDPFALEFLACSFSFKSPWGRVDGDYPITVPFEGIPKDNGCWVFAAYKETIGYAEDLGAGTVQQGTVISSSSANPLSARGFFSKTYGYSKRIFDKEKKWQSKPAKGSLICKNKKWHACDTKKGANGQALFIGKTKYSCQNERWVKGQ